MMPRDFSNDIRGRAVKRQFSDKGGVASGLEWSPLFFNLRIPCSRNSTARDDEKLTPQIFAGSRAVYFSITDLYGRERKDAERPTSDLRNVLHSELRAGLKWLPKQSPCFLVDFFSPFGRSWRRGSAGPAYLDRRRGYDRLDLKHGVRKRTPANWQNRQ